MAIKSYKKLTKGPLGLGKGLTITDDTFTDKKFNEVNKKKLKAALRVNMVEEIDKLVDTTDKSLNLDDKIEDLNEELERITKERDDALAELAELKGGDEDAWITMSEEELAAAYTVPELKALIKDNFEGVNVGRRATQPALTKMIVELITKANKEFDANLAEYNAEGFNAEGFNAEGFNAEGFNAEGFNAEGNKA